MPWIVPSGSSSFPRPGASVALLLMAGALASCTGPATRAPLSHGSSRWEYLVERYDADGDGRIEAAEYGRGPQGFANLDRDEDGVLTPADFERGRGSTDEALTSGLLFRNFHFDDDDDTLHRHELADCVEAYDDDEDGRLSREEFAALQEDRGIAPLEGVMAAMVGDSGEFDTLLEVMDADADGRLAVAELGEFHDRAYDEAFGSVVARGGEGPGEEDESGPAPGTPAPDFRLSPVGGGDPVRLSDFVGDRPVALIFGSYT